MLGINEICEYVQNNVLRDKNPMGGKGEGTAWIVYY